VDIPNIGTFRHERGPSLLLLPNVYREVFQDCSTKPAEDFGLIMDQCIPAYQVVFEDGDSIEVGFPHDQMGCNQGTRGGVGVSLEDTISENESRSRTKMDTYEKDGAKKWDEYLQIMSAFLDCGLPNFIEEKLDLLSLPSFLYEALRDSAKVRKWSCTDPGVRFFWTHQYEKMCKPKRMR
jgi:phytoene dehydrogenase-like protein